MNSVDAIRWAEEILDAEYRREDLVRRIALTLQDATQQTAMGCAAIVSDLKEQIWDLRNHLYGISITSDAGLMAEMARKALERNVEPGMQRRGAPVASNSFRFTPGVRCSYVIEGKPE